MMRIIDQQAARLSRAERMRSALRELTDNLLDLAEVTVRVHATIAWRMTRGLARWEAEQRKKP